LDFSFLLNFFFAFVCAALSRFILSSECVSAYPPQTVLVSPAFVFVFTVIGELLSLVSVRLLLIFFITSDSLTYSNRRARRQKPSAGQGRLPLLVENKPLMAGALAGSQDNRTSQPPKP